MISRNKASLISAPSGCHILGLTHDLARTPAFGSSGVLFHIPGSLSPSLKILGIIPKRQTYKRALQRIYLERGSVHACILLCTRGYTVVYTRVYSSLLGRRDTLGVSTPRTRILLSSAHTPSRPCPRTIVISCVSPAHTVGIPHSIHGYDTCMGVPNPLV